MRYGFIFAVCGALVATACSSSEPAPTAATEQAPAPSTTPEAKEPSAPQPAAAAKEPEVLTVDQASALFDAKQAVPVDANGADTRKQMGVIPGARLLSSSSDYDCAKELPDDKSTTLVFYCGGERCTASDTAAARAMANGYEHVKILRAGISGWREGGRPTETPAS